MKQGSPPPMMAVWEPCQLCSDIMFHRLSQNAWICVILTILSSGTFSTELYTDFVISANRVSK